MATLVSPGVSVTLTNESFYASAGTGTVPLIVIATAQDKYQTGSTTAIASGTVKTDAGKLRLITSQRDALQTYGAPNFYSVGGTAQYDNELNELGLYALYEYLGIANSAYVIRADVDLAQLAPSTTEPTGLPSNGDYWLDLSQSSYGLFTSTGDPNSAYAWQSKVPAVISNKTDLERIVQGQISNPAPLPSATQSVITSNGTLRINNVSIALLSGDSLTTVINKINSSLALRSLGISATAFVRTEKYYNDGTSIAGLVYGDVYNLRIVCADADTPIRLDGTSSSVLTNLGFANTTPVNFVVPASNFGSPGDLAIDTVSTSTIGMVSEAHKNQIWQKVSLTTSTGTTAWWFLVGSTDSTMQGWGWREATPRVVTGSVANPTFTVGEAIKIAVGSSGDLVVTIPTLNPGETSFDAFLRALNSAFNLNSINAVARKEIVGANSYLQIINFDATDLWMHDQSLVNAVAKPLGNAGVSTSSVFFGSVQGTVANPGPFNAPSMFVASATVANPGVGYAVGDLLDVVGGVGSTAQLVVQSVKAVPDPAWGIVNGGTGYSPRDTLTLSSAGFASPVVIRVETVNANGTIITASILQAGQLTASPPSNPVSIPATSGAGTGATFNLHWGVSTVGFGNPAVPGTYSSMPISPAGVDTNNFGANATLNLTTGYYAADSFTVNLGGNVTKTIYVPGTTLDGVVQAINDAFPEYVSLGMTVASKVTVGSNNYLLITNPNGTNFTLKDVSGTPLRTAGIPVGTVFGKQLIYKGYSPSLQVPKLLSELAVDNIWMNTTSQNRGSSFVIKQYQNGTWVKLNTTPNTGVIPMYNSTTVADTAFGPAKSIGSVFMLYNADNAVPPVAQLVPMRWDGSSWQPLVYSASSMSPLGAPAAGTYWYNTDLMVDIMVSNGQQWLGYANAYPGTDPNGPILDASAPLTQSTGAALVDFDIWVNTSDIENYPNIYRYNALTASWILIDNTDHSSSAGIIFADARPNTNGLRTGSMLPSAMIVSNYVDSDAPNAELYPDGLLLFNTRYSTNNVKVWVENYLPNATWKDRWVTASGNKPDGTPYMGHWSQRNIVVTALKEVIVSNQDARAEQSAFNLIACPGYTETLADMITLNTDKKETAFIIADTPARLDPTANSIQNWATNANGAALDGPDGLISHSTYAGLYYPWALATNLDGNTVFVPPSVMALRTFAYNDQVAYPWFAPAGFNRGLVTGVSSVGYLTADNTFQFLQLSQGQRDVLYTNSINPVAYIPNRGLVIYGQKTLAPVASAPDRINVARLLNYLNYQLDQLALPFLFEPNDEQTRKAVTTTFTSFMGNLVGQRALYDFAVVCDDTNNTPARIDRNELWIDIAIKPEKAIEFIYIPIRLLNTGDPMPGANRTTTA